MVRSAVLPARASHHSISCATRLHLAEGKGDNSQDIGYRPWMRNGVSLTGNADQGYMGQKYTYEHPQDYGSGELKDYTDLVLQWSDNPGKELKDRMRFIHG